MAQDINYHPQREHSVEVWGQSKIENQLGTLQGLISKGSSDLQLLSALLIATLLWLGFLLLWKDTMTTATLINENI